MRLQIEADKAARNAKFAREKALRDGAPLPVVEDAPRAAAPVRATATGAASTVTRLQIRLMDGRQIVKTFDVDQTLAAVISTCISDGSADPSNFSDADLVCAFPRYVFPHSLSITQCPARRVSREYY